MVARNGNAPLSSGCEPAALLLSYQAWKGWNFRKVAPAPGDAPGFSDRKSDVLLLHHAGLGKGKRRNWRSTKDLHPGSHGMGQLFSRQFPRLAGRAPKEILKLDWEIGCPPWARTTTCRLTGGHCYFDISGQNKKEGGQTSSSDSGR